MPPLDGRVRTLLRYVIMGNLIFAGVHLTTRISATPGILLDLVGSGTSRAPAHTTPTNKHTQSYIRTCLRAWVADNRAGVQGRYPRVRGTSLPWTCL
jgi:hypothetical protein